MKTIEQLTEQGTALVNELNILEDELNSLEAQSIEKLKEKAAASRKYLNYLQELQEYHLERLKKENPIAYKEIVAK